MVKGLEVSRGMHIQSPSFVIVCIRSMRETDSRRDLGQQDFSFQYLGIWNSRYGLSRLNE
jgi:hypothetical protein